MKRLALLLCPLLALLGCKSAPADSPEACFEQFDAAMRAGDTAAAAALIDFDRLAAAANPDWDSIPPGQRQQITTKMREDAAGRLQALGYPAAGLTAAPPEVLGERATLVASGEGQELRLTLHRSGDGWRITGGLPTMTTDAGLTSR